MTDEKMLVLLEKVEQLRERYDGLHLKFRQGNAFLVGVLKFNAMHGEDTITDCYRIEICVPSDYPLRPPVVKETGGRIPRNTDHHVNPDKTLCLGPPIELVKKFKREPTLLGYIENLLIPKLYWHSYNQRHPETPLGAYSHGDEGIREYRENTNLQATYFEIFEVNDLSIVLRFLEIIVKGTQNSNSLCPCNRGQTLSTCHGKILESLLEMPYLKKNHLALDYWYLRDKVRRPQKSL